MKQYHLILKHNINTSEIYKVHLLVLMGGDICKSLHIDSICNKSYFEHQNISFIWYALVNYTIFLVNETIILLMLRFTGST